MYKTLLDKEEYRLALYVVLQDNQANLDFVYDEGIVGFEAYDKVFQKAGFEFKIDGGHFVNLNCPISELQKIAKHLSSEFKKMDINPLELTEKASFNEKALIQQVKFGFSREGIEKMNQWINQNGWRKDKKVNYWFKKSLEQKIHRKFSVYFFAYIKTPNFYKIPCKFGKNNIK